jgi:hypothetical protein
MQAISIADEVLIQLGENVHMYIGTRAKPNIRVNLKGNAKYVSMSTCTYIEEPHIPCNSHKYKYIYMHLYKKKTIRTHMLYTRLSERMCATKVRLA